MKRCSACRKPYRVGTLVYVAHSLTGQLKLARVCKDCERSSSRILTRPIEASACKCGSPATTCVACVRDAEKADPKKRFAAAIKKIKNTIEAYARTGGREDDEMRFQIVGLEQAVDILEAGDF